jgi:hypothetical protein
VRHDEARELGALGDVRCSAVLGEPVVFVARPVCEWSTLSTTLEFCVGPIRNGFTVTVAPLTSV